MISKEEDYFDNEYYKINLQFFRLIGLCQKTSSKNIIHICFINFILAFALFEQMKKILFRIKSDWDDLANKPELVILKKYAEISRLCTLTIAISFYLYIVFLIFPSLLSVCRYVSGSINETELILPVRVDSIMNNRMLYYIWLIIEYIIILNVGNVGIANYSMFIVVIQHACALLTIVRFIDLFKSFYEAIHLLEEFFGFIIILLFQIISLTFNLTEGLTKFFFIVGTLLIMYAYFYLAQNLINHNVNVFTIFCQIPFYSLSLKTQNLLLVLIMRSMRPCNLSLMGAIAVSNDLFATFMSKSFSFAMVLYSLQ
ncbi:uncharacterized protein LOC118446652 [Vespa mandarinia]|uniref:uncharacterized protein LOC118446652 n=1 Tax=Vespa mandarinia TaxID=7446 RepID=UPI00160D7A82|nr:uncharacterized protein LOC118446652 [Vespa mandarinia]